MSPAASQLALAMLIAAVALGAWIGGEIRRRIAQGTLRRPSRR